MHPLEGLRYLQTELADVVDHSDIEETRQVRTLILQSCFGDISLNKHHLKIFEHEFFLSECHLHL